MYDFRDGRVNKMWGDRPTGRPPLKLRTTVVIRNTSELFVERSRDCYCDDKTSSVIHHKSTCRSKF